MGVGPTQAVDHSAANAVDQQLRETRQTADIHRSPREAIATRAEEARRPLEDGTVTEKAVQAVRENLSFTEGMLKGGGIEFLKASLERRVSSLFSPGVDGQHPQLAEYERQSDAVARGDISPRSIAEGVTSAALKRYPSFREQNPGLSEEYLRDRFADVVKKQLDEGFEQARQTLRRADMMTRELDNAMQGTYAALQQQLAAALGERS
jgi:hypothetical protein